MVKFIELATAPLRTNIVGPFMSTCFTPGTFVLTALYHHKHMKNMRPIALFPIVCIHFDVPYNIITRQLRVKCDGVARMQGLTNTACSDSCGKSSCAEHFRLTSDDRTHERLSRCGFPETRCSHWTFCLVVKVTWRILLARFSLV